DSVATSAFAYSSHWRWDPAGHLKASAVPSAAKGVLFRKRRSAASAAPLPVKPRHIRARFSALDRGSRRIRAEIPPLPDVRPDPRRCVPRLTVLRPKARQGGSADGLEEVTQISGKSC